MSETPCAKNYLFFQGGPGHSRRPRPNPPTGGLIPIPGLSDTIYLTEGQPIGGTELLPSSVYQSGSGTANYIFLSISGAQSGNQTWIAPQNYANLLQQKPRPEASSSSQFDTHHADLGVPLANSSAKKNTVAGFQIQGAALLRCTTKTIVPYRPWILNLKNP